jgi:hypothetical protein
MGYTSFGISTTEFLSGPVTVPLARNCGTKLSTVFNILRNEMHKHVILFSTRHY